MMVKIDLSSQDSPPSIAARLRSVGAERVLLAVPKSLTLSAFDLRMVARAAADSGLQVALLTGDPALRSLAESAGLSTFRDESWAARAPWRRTSRRRGAAAPPTPAGIEAPPRGLLEPPSPTGFRPISFLRSFVRVPNQWWAMVGLLAALLLLFGGLLYALTAILPAAIITLTPAAEPIQVTVQLKAVQDGVSDPAAGLAPAQALSVQVAGEARTATSGRRNEPATKAGGEVTFINRSSSPVLVPAGTVVSTATGFNVQFVTALDVPLDANGRARVAVQATLPGPDGNARAGTVTRVEGPLSLSVLANNEANFTGGTTAPAGVVTEDDQKRLQAQLFEALKVQALERLNERLEPGSFLPAESVSYLALSPTFTPFVGEVAQELFLSMSVQAVGLVVDLRSGNEAAMQRLRSEMPPGSRVISDTLQFIPGEVVLVDPKTIDFSVTAQGTLLRGPDEETVRRSVLGLRPDDAANALAGRFSLARPPVISLGPDWLPYVVPTRLPVLPWRVRVVTDWDAAGGLERRGQGS